MSAFIIIILYVHNNLWGVINVTGGFPLLDYPKLFPSWQSWLLLNYTVLLHKQLNLVPIGRLRAHIISGAFSMLGTGVIAV